MQIKIIIMKISIKYNNKILEEIVIKIKQLKIIKIE